MAKEQKFNFFKLIFLCLCCCVCNSVLYISFLNFVDSESYGLKESDDSEDGEDGEDVDEEDERTLSYRSPAESPDAHGMQLQTVPVVSQSVASIESGKSSVSLDVANIEPVEEREMGLVPVLANEGQVFGCEQSTANSDDDEVETADLEHLEQKLRDAWIQMRRLDKKLARCTRKERTVKKETAALIEKNRAELHQLRLDSNHKETKWEAENTAHFLALSYHDLDDEIKQGEMESADDCGPSTPLFKTQVPYDCDNVSLMDEEATSTSTSTSTTKQSMPFPPSSSKKAASTGNASGTSAKTGSTPKNKYAKVNSKYGKGKPQQKQQQTASEADKANERVNFIKRNIQLAQDNAGALAMTEEEKQRLNELLIGMEEFDTATRSLEEGKNQNQPAVEQEEARLVEYNPFAVSLVPGDGFTLDKSDENRMREINTRLERRGSRIGSCLNGGASSIGSSSRLGAASTFTKRSSTNTAYTVEAESYYGIGHTEPQKIRLDDNFDENDFGDKFIREARLSREHEQKLKAIEMQLKSLKNAANTAAQGMSQDGSQIDLQSDSASCHTVSLVDESTIKELIDEYNHESQAISIMTRNNNNK